jgi:hypothetical protein
MRDCRNGVVARRNAPTCPLKPNGRRRKLKERSRKQSRVFLRLEPNCLAHARNDDLASIAQKFRHVLRQASVRSRVARRL